MPDLPVLEVFCRCAPGAALTRYRARAATRHAGHFDAERSVDELQDPEVSRPVAGGWPVVEVDTNSPVDVAALIDRIETALTPEA